jgi:Ca2+-binding RTX toxin-like protein
MATHSVSKDRDTIWRIIGDHDTWNLAKNATIEVRGHSAIHVPVGSNHNDLNIYGDIVASGTRGTGITVKANFTDITIGAQSTIRSNLGIISIGGATDVVNHGVISAQIVGIATTSTLTHIVNSGEIDGNIGIWAMGAGSRIVNRADGEIWGAEAGVIMNAPGARLVNDGFISGASFGAVQGGDGAQTVINHGRIDNHVFLGDGNDVFDTRGGVLHGLVGGSGGNDTYFVSSANVRIREYAGEGNDTLKSTVSVTLNNNVEKLVLLGKADISGTGNNGDNTLVGNAGKNVLTGGSGADTLRGGKGNDILIGGADADIFMFVKGSGVDTVKDFEDGTDIIGVSKFSGITDYAALQSHISDHGKHVWIDLGGGDKMVIKNIDAAALDAADFQFTI